jgi:hypothetical protein
VVDGHLETRDREHVAVGERLDVVGLGPLQAATEERRRLRRDAGQWVGHHEVVSGVQVRRDAPCAADRRDRERVVEVPVGQQHRYRLQPVLAQHLVQLVDHVDAGVDDDRVLAGPGSHDVAVGAERGGGEAGDEHEHPSELEAGSCSV